MVLADALERFYRDLEVGRSPATVTTYCSALRRFSEMLGPDATLESLTADDPVAFARLVSDHGRAPRTTVQLYTTAVTRFYAFLVREDLRPDLPLAKLQLRLTQLRGKRPKSLPKVPTDDLMARIVAAARAVPPGTTVAAERIRLRNL